jgi:hypothetical protein
VLRQHAAGREEYEPAACAPVHEFVICGGMVSSCGDEFARDAAVASARIAGKPSTTRHRGGNG